jgi:hypothetical protein
MSNPSDNLQDNLKRREIYFNKLHPDHQPARTAALVLEETPGIVRLNASSSHLLEVDYELHLISLKEIEALLVEVGFHLAGDLLVRLKRALYYYTEEIQRENQGHAANPLATRQVFIERYQRLNHECRDERSAIWRHYR